MIAAPRSCAYTTCASTSRHSPPPRLQDEASLPMSVTVELYGLEIPGAHGVEEEERRQPQPFVYDIWLDVPEDAISDRLDKTVDYRDVASCIRELSDGRQFRLLEAIAAAAAETLLERFRL